MISLILAMITGFFLVASLLFVSIVNQTYDDARERVIANVTTAFLVILVMSLGLPPLKPFLLNLAAVLFGGFLGLSKEKFDDLYNTANEKK